MVYDHFQHSNIRNDWTQITEEPKNKISSSSTPKSMTKLSSIHAGVLPRPLRPDADPTVLLPEELQRTNAIMQVQGRRGRSPSGCVPSITSTEATKQTRRPNAVKSLLARPAVSILMRPRSRPARATQAKRSAYYHVKSAFLLFLLVPFLETCVSREKMRKRAWRWEWDSCLTPPKPKITFVKGIALKF